MSEPSPEQSFSIHLKSLTDFADEFTTQIQSLQAPMDHLATMSGTPPQYGAFHEAWSLGAGEQAAIEEMFNLLGQVKQAVAFAGDVTGTVADNYRNADEDIAYGLGGPPQNTYGGGPVSGPWGGGDPYGGQNQNQQYPPYSDPTQNNQGNQVIATPVSTQTNPNWVPNQNTSGPFPGTPLTAVPVAGALLGGALLGVVGKSKANANQAPPAGTTSGGQTFDDSFDSGGSDSSLWTPPPAPGQEAPWTAAFPGSPQGGS
ncbi:hypothetical protein ABH920_008928 [Catenulispora sp. EB89]|uniref:hypothetical protein n=1 Tax=Catenulispora sp. EB89 TaxID=3156257 RepID=UPI0035169C0F